MKTEAEKVVDEIVEATVVAEEEVDPIPRPSRNRSILAGTLLGSVGGLIMGISGGMVSACVLSAIGGGVGAFINLN